MTAIPNASTTNWFKLKGATTELSRGLSTAYQSFSVSKPGEFNFKMSDTHTSVKIMNSRNEVVADASSGADIGQAHAKLGPGTYTAVIQQKYKGVNNRAYNLEVTPRENPMLTAAGGTLKSTARPLTGQDNGVQKHGLTVAQGGEFAINVSLPNTRWSIMTKEGKLVASGDTMSAANGQLDVLNKKFKLEPGEYQVVAVLPRDTKSEVPWRMDFIPKVAGADAAASAKEERPIDKILREREDRLKQWAAQDAAKGTGTSA
ncbi:MAG TPA: hypothetical protein PKZ97_11100 [Azospirillaceae bacterium]|nr:hypothetical protein [Azospirillaceae bacterium]HRQ81655.1 hypothetical protein [Azospirillaceae bacterium]